MVKLAEECCGVSCLLGESTFPLLPEACPQRPLPGLLIRSLERIKGLAALIEPDRFPSRLRFSQKEKEKVGWLSQERLIDFYSLEGCHPA